MPLMVGGSVAAHSLGSILVASRTPVESDGGVELATRVDHGYVTSLPVVGGLVIALVLVAVGLSIRDRLRGDGHRGASPTSFLLLPPLAYSLQEIVERLLHTESYPFNPVHEPAFLIALLLQVPFGLFAFFLGRLLLDLGRTLARVLSSAKRLWPTSRPMSHRTLRDPIVLRTSVLALGHCVRAPPVVAASR